MTEVVTTDQQTAHKLRWPLVINYAAMMALALAINLLPVFLTTLGRDLGGLSNEQLGRLSAIGFSGLCIGIALAGPLADRFGPRFFAVAGNLLIAIGLAGMAGSSNYSLVAASLFIMGFGAGLLDMVLSPIVAALQPHKRVVAMNLLHSFYCTGAVLAVLVGSLALKLNFGWRAACIGLVPLPLIVGISFARVYIPPLVAEDTERTPILTLLRRPLFIATMIALFLGGATEVGMAAWMPTYAERQLGYPKFTADMGFLAFNIAMAVGRIGAGILGHKLKATTILLWCCWSSVALFLIACFAPWSIVAFIGCIIAGLTGSCLWPSTLAVAADRYPHGGATMYGLLALLGNAGCIFMPWLVGIIADRTSGNIALGLATAALCPFLMALIVHVIANRKHA